MIKALRSHVAGGPESLVIDEIPAPVPAANEILIAVKAGALNYPDILMIQDLYQAKPPRPFIPGAEVAGIVEAIGSEVKAFAPGDRVIGLLPWGGLAEKIAVPAGICLSIDAKTSDVDAAALPVTFGTSHYALRDQAAIQPGETLLVLGAAGGVGIAAVQLGKVFGAYVVAAVSSEEKARIAIEQGADTAIVYPRVLSDKADKRAFTEQIRSACPKGSADVIYDPVGGDYAEPAFRSLGWQGRYLIIGFPAGIPSLPLNLPLLKGAKAIGVFYGDFVRREPEKRAAYMREIADLQASGAIRPLVSLRLPLAEAAEGFKALAERRSHGKIVIEF